MHSGGQYRGTFLVPLPVPSVRGTEYRYRGTFSMKYPGTPSNSKVIESFLQALRHVFIFRIDCSFKGVS